MFRNASTGDGAGWSVDLPRADENLSFRFFRVTRTSVSPHGHRRLQSRPDLADRCRAARAVSVHHDDGTGRRPIRRGRGDQPADVSAKAVPLRTRGVIYAFGTLQNESGYSAAVERLPLMDVRSITLSSTCSTTSRRSRRPSSGTGAARQQHVGSAARTAPVPHVRAISES